ncbi:MAG: DUF6644 family protein [Phenylobacterium sp.]
MELLFHAFAATPLSHAIRASTYGFAIIEMFHLIALAVLGGGLLIVALAALGIGLQKPSWLITLRGLRGLIGWSLAAMVASGVLLVGSNPMKYYFNPAFRVKMALLAALIVALSALIAWASSATPQRLRLRLAATSALALWLGVGLAGRLIGFL